MKVAGSSWWAYPLPLFLLCASLPSANSSLFDSSCAADTSFLEDKSPINELASVSRRAELTEEMTELLEPYDATPFWYNLVQAVMMASGVHPTTQHVMHELATSSFHGSALNDSIRKIISLVRCRSEEVLRLPNEEVPGNSLSETLQDSDDIPAKSLAENGVEREWGKGVLESRLGTIEWLPSKNKLSDTWNPEDENEANSILGPISPSRLRRELRDGRRGGVRADVHQPFFMSEAGPSSLVTRDPAIISVSGCPSGHIKDLKGSCRQIFQYTVNFGTNNLPSSNGIFANLPSRSPPWSFSRPPPRRPGTLRDIARDSSLFKHSVMRGYVPPFVYPPRLHQPAPPSPQAVNGNKIEPMEITAPVPQIVIMETPTVPAIASPVDPPAEQRADQSSGGSSSESSSYSSSKDSKTSKYRVKQQDDDD